MAKAEELVGQSWTRKLVPDGDGWFASIEELAGCIAEGDSPEEALQHLEAALLDWLAIALERGHTIPEPRGNDLRFSGRFSIRGPRSLHRQLVERASAEGCSLNHLVTTILAKATQA